MRIPELRSPYDKVDGLVYFGRMIDKIRLHAAGKLPAEYVPNLGAFDNFQGFDGRCCRFLNIDYLELAEAVKERSSETELLKMGLQSRKKTVGLGHRGLERFWSALRECDSQKC
jgi:hypothetical protein